MTWFSRLTAVGLVFGVHTGTNAERVWSICKGVVPALPSLEAMEQDVEIGVQANCSQEYTFEELCDVDFNGLDSELHEEGILFLKAMNRMPSSPDGGMSAPPDCSPGFVCYLFCTSGSAVVELAEESADPPSTVASSTVPPTPEQVQASCSPDYFTEQEVLDGALFKYRQEFLMAQGVDAESDSLACPCIYPCPYSEPDARHMKPGEEAPIALVTKPTYSSPVRLRGASHYSGGDAAGIIQAKGCNTTLAALVNMTAAEVLAQFPHLGFMKPEPAARTMSRFGRAFKKLVIRRAVFTSAAQRLTLTSYLGQQLEIDARSGAATLTQADSSKTEVLDGQTICVFNVPREAMPAMKHLSTKASMMQGQKRQRCSGDDCEGSAALGALMTSGSFTMMAASAG